jgi:hemolysin activation/secretion protein
VQQINPGAIQNEQRRNLQRLEQQQEPEPPSGPAVTGTPPARPLIGLPSGVHFVLKGVEFDASAFLTKDELEAIAARYVGRDIDFAQLQELISAVDDLYQSKGIITASAVLPPQRVKDGQVHIALVEGKLGKTAVSGGTYTDPDFVTDRVTLVPGAVVDVPQLTRDVTYFNRTNDIRLRAMLQPGGSFGQTDVELAVEEPPRNVLDIFADNQGVDSTDRNEGGAFFRHNTLLLTDDLVTLYMTGSSGALNGNASYSIPVGPWGSRFGLSYARNRITVVQGAFSPLGITGTAQTISGNLSHPLWVDDTWLLVGNLSVAKILSKNDTGSFQTTNTSTYKGSAGFTLSATGQDYSVSTTQNFNLADASNRTIDQSRYMRIYNASATGTVQLWGGFSGVLVSAWQYSPQKLLTAEQLFQIGGPTTIRGYQSSLLAGDDGYYFQTELHHPLDFALDNADAYVFFDRGTVFSTFPQSQAIGSIGAGASWSFSSWGTAEISAAFPLNHNVPGQPDARVYGRLTFHIL